MAYKKNTTANTKSHKLSTKAKHRGIKVVDTTEPDSAYFLKLVLYVIVGAQWLRVTTTSGAQFPLPVGLVLGLLFASHEHFQVDRKIQYAILLVATMVGFFAQVGLYASF
jgi:hypothetical protein